MFSVLRKELRIFLVSFSAYIFIAVFLLSCSAFLWIIPDGMNILDNNYANLDSFFEFAPIVFLFLISALCMRLFSEEKKTGTFELLISRPISLKNIVLGKYFSALIVIFFALIPTLLYFFTVHQLSQPVGNIDMGAIVGSFIGLGLLACAYTAISLFCSSLTSQQIIAFVISVVLCFVFYQGFEFLTKLSFTNQFSNILHALSINEHYLSLSRGVVDTRDLIYFLSLIFVFIVFTIFNLKSRYR